MSIDLARPIVPTIALKMLSGNTRLLGIPKQRVQVVMILPHITEFNEELKNAIDFFKERAESFIITSSTQKQCDEVIANYKIKENLISREYQDFSKVFAIKDQNGLLEKGLMIIDTNCQITHKDIL
ncbi:MAG: hypothetical protein ACNI3C_03995 [Candidatus Marinarcus sp.]|uniref:hypothetical protein n=1 Tax=Candidatus Marinarcus sp. TaxID=3100987 RepID=UPI003AFFA56D